MLIINNKNINAYNSIFVIAEVASSHDGNLSLAKKITEAVVSSGADAIKYQMFNVDSLLVPHHHKYSDFQQIELKENEWCELINYAHSLGVFVIAEVFDEKSFDLALSLGIECYKLPTSDLSNPLFLEYVAKKANILILSIGASSYTEIDSAVKLCEKCNNKSLILMHGFQSFPTKIEDTLFSLIKYLNKKYNYLVGFADHIDADSKYANVFPLVAIGYGSAVIEKHITLDRSLKGRDYYSALEPKEFKKMVEDIRNIELAYGAVKPGVSVAERKYRKLMKKKIVASRNIKRGEFIRKEDVFFKRTDCDGLAPEQVELILKKANKDISLNDVIRECDVC